MRGSFHNKEYLRKLIDTYNPISAQEESDKKIMLRFIDEFDDVATRTNPFGHFTASAFVVNESGTKTLLLHHNIFNGFVFPGGHADGEYDLLSVATREVEEETGLVVSPMNNGQPFAIQNVPIRSHMKRGKVVSPHMHYDVAFLFIAKDEDMNKIRICESENSAVQWVSLNDAFLEDMVAWFVPVYIKMKERFKKLNEKN